MTRILNGCAEARTVGTHYSTTHPPPLSQNSTSSSCSFFSFSFCCLRLRRSRASPSRSFVSRGPLFPTSRWLVLQTRTTFGPPLAPLSFSQRTRVHPARGTAKLFRLYSYIAHVFAACVCALTHMTRAKHTHVTSSFHSISRFILFPCSAGLLLSSSSSFLREA